MLERVVGQIKSKGSGNEFFWNLSLLCQRGFLGCIPCQVNMPASRKQIRCKICKFFWGFNIIKLNAKLINDKEIQ
jgi:hypothetical protein